MGQSAPFQHKGHTFEIVWDDNLDETVVGVFVNGKKLLHYIVIPMSAKIAVGKRYDLKQMIIESAKEDVEQDALPEVRALVPK